MRGGSPQWNPLPLWMINLSGTTFRCGHNIVIADESAIAVFRQQPLLVSTNSTAFIDLPASPP
jgi:hypothetical protein